MERFGEYLWKHRNIFSFLFLLGEGGKRLELKRQGVNTFFTMLLHLLAFFVSCTFMRRECWWSYASWYKSICLEEIPLGNGAFLFHAVLEMNFPFFICIRTLSPKAVQASTCFNFEWMHVFLFFMWGQLLFHLLLQMSYKGM